MSISYYDFKKRLKLALSVERGSDLIGIQHGGAYGTFSVHSLDTWIAELFKNLMGNSGG